MVKVIMSVNGEILSACHSVFGTLQFLHWKVPRPRPSWGAVRQQAKRLKIKEWLLHWKISVDDSFTYFFFPQAQTMAAAGWWVRALNDRKQSANLVSFLISGENPTVRMLWGDFFSHEFDAGKRQIEDEDPLLCFFILKVTKRENKIRKCSENRWRRSHEKRWPLLLHLLCKLFIHFKGLLHI